MKGWATVSSLPREQVVGHEAHEPLADRRLALRRAGPVQEGVVHLGPRLDPVQEGDEILAQDGEDRGDEASVLPGSKRSRSASYGRMRAPIPTERQAACRFLSSTMRSRWGAKAGKSFPARASIQAAWDRLVSRASSATRSAGSLVVPVVGDAQDAKVGALRSGSSEASPAGRGSESSRGRRGVRLSRARQAARARGPR